MKPIAPLMIEHRLIERMIRILKIELENIKKTKKTTPVLIENAVDFIRSYADQTPWQRRRYFISRITKKEDFSGTQDNNE